uniref:PABS domain-containing protein n=1 Tax=viral metagenome TaxID=1070528 RepID=A0A6C0APE3_9ZZZZ
MPGLTRIKSVHEFTEKDPDQGVNRTYKYYSTYSTHLHSSKQEIDLLETNKWGKMLFLDGCLQSTTMDEVIYHDALVHPLLSSVMKKKKILILGGGEGATAREVLRWPVSSVEMVDYDKELVEHMQLHGAEWSKGAWKDYRLKVFYDCAWAHMAKGLQYDAVIVDLTDPDFKEALWLDLLTNVIKSVKESKGGFVMNAGLYLPWDTARLKEIVGLIQHLCLKNPEFKYYIYTAFIPSFSGEWTFIAMVHKQRFMIEPEHLDLIPAWIRRSIKTLPDSLLEQVSTQPILSRFII